MSSNQEIHSSHERFLLFEAGTEGTVSCSGGSVEIRDLEWGGKLFESGAIASGVPTLAGSIDQFCPGDDGNTDVSNRMGREPFEDRRWLFLDQVDADVGI